MVAITREQIPSSALTSIESLMAWCGFILKRYNPRSTAIEVDGGDPIKTSQAVIITDEDGNDRVIVRMSAIIDPAWTSDTATKVWAKVRPLAEPSEIASTFKA